MMQRGSVESSEPTFYRVEDLVHFFPGENTLYNVSNAETITLLSTASDCFKVLIQERGRIISKEEMKELVWGKRGVIVSCNTYYQNMLNLRRGLTKIGVDVPVISTHYGKGVSIDEDVKITPVYPMIADLKSQGNELENVMPSQNVDLSDEQSISTNLVSTPMLTEDGRSYLPLLACINILFLVTCFIVHLNTISMDNMDYFSKYNKSDSFFGNCEIFSNYKQIDDNKLLKLLKQLPVCQNGEKVYLTTAHPLNSVSVIRCEGEFKLGDECESDFYLD